VRYSWDFPASDPHSHRDERAGLIAALVLVVQTIFFFIFYQQMSTSLNLFAQKKSISTSACSAGTCSPGFRAVPEPEFNLDVLLSPVLV